MTALAFPKKLTDQFDAVQLVLFGSRDRCDYHNEIYADVAIVLAGQPLEFVDIKLAMVAVVFDVLTETGVRIQALPDCSIRGAGFG